MGARHVKFQLSIANSFVVIVIKPSAGGTLWHSMGNYRPVALACVVSKVLEGVLLAKMEPYLHTADNQFG